jgi:hypothetical protein
MSQAEAVCDGTLTAKGCFGPTAGRSRNSTVAVQQTRAAQR